jgi:hypothetical protein
MCGTVGDETCGTRCYLDTVYQLFDFSDSHFVNTAGT